MSRIIKSLKTFWRRLNGGRVVITAGVLIALFVWLVVPTGTPDDLLTSVPLYLWLGEEGFLWLVGIAVGVAIAYEKRWI